MKPCTRTHPTAPMVAAVAVLMLASAGVMGEGRRPPVSLPGTEVRSIQSSFIDQEFKLHIYLPAGYTDSTRVFPVVYLTDSDAYFGFVRSLAGNLHYGNMIPEIVIVGIAYEEDTQSYLRKRERDLLPAAVAGRPGSGNAESFLAFMRDELIPFVESHYRVDSGDRTIAGMSAGATFALYALFTSPELFGRYIVVSPYLIYGQEEILELENAFAAEHDSLSARVYTAMGELEPASALGPWKTLVTNIDEKNYVDLVLCRDTLEGLSHMDVVFTAYVNGLKEVFADRTRTLRAVPENFRACAGRFELRAQGIRFTVRLDAGRLYISKSGEYWDELVPVGDTRFGVEGVADVKFSFMADGDAAASKMILHQLGMEVPAERIE